MADAFTSGFSIGLQLNTAEFFKEYSSVEKTLGELEGVLDKNVTGGFAKIISQVGDIGESLSGLIRPDLVSQFTTINDALDGVGMALNAQIDTSLVKISKMGVGVEHIADDYKELLASIISSGTELTENAAQYTDVAELVTKTLTETTLLSNQLDKQGVQYADIAENVSKTLADTMAINNIQDKQAELMEDAVESSTKTVTNAIKTNEELTLQNSLLEKLGKTVQSTLSIQKLENELGKKLTEEINGTANAITKKNKRHDEQNKKMFEGSQLANAILNTHKWMGDEVKKIAGNLVEQLGALISIARVWGEMLADAEKFVTANYRAYGSQTRMVTQAYMLGAQYGVATDKALEAYKAMADIRAPQTEINQLTGSVAQFHRVTGVGIDSTAKLVKNLRSIGYDAEQSRKFLTNMANDMRKFGLSTQEVTGIIDSMPSAYVMGKLFGENAAEQFVAIQGRMTRLTGEIGMSSESTRKWFETIASGGPESTAILAAMQAQLGTVPDDLHSIEEGYLKIGQQAYETYQRTLESSGSASIAMTTMQSQMAETYKLNKEGAEAAMSMYEKAMAAGAKSTTMEEYLKAFKVPAEEFKTLTALFEESSETVMESLKQIGSIFNAVFGFALEPLMELLIGALRVLMAVLNLIKPAFQWIGDLVRGLKDSTESWKVVLGYTLQIFIGLLTLASVKLFALIGLVGKLIMAIPGLGTAFTWLKTTVVKSIEGIFSAIGRMITGLFGAIGNAIRALLTPLKGLQMEMIAFSIFILAVAASLYILAKAMEIIAGLGDKAQQALIDTALALGILTVAVAALALVAVNAGVPLLIMGVAMLALGAGCYLLARAIQIVVKAIKELAGVGLGEIVMVGVKLAATAAIIAAAGVAFGAAAVPLVAGATVLAKGMALAALAIGGGYLLMKAAMWGLADIAEDLSSMAPDMIKGGEAMKVFGEGLSGFTMPVEVIDKLNAVLEEFIGMVEHVYDASMLMFLAMNNIRFAIESLFYVNFGTLISYLEYWTNQIIDAFMEITKIDFNEVAETLEGGLRRISRVFGAIGNVALKEDLETLHSTLNQYSEYLNTVADKLEVISKNRLTPMMTEIRDKLNDTVKAEAFSTVKVLHQVEGGTQDQMGRLVELQSNTNSLLSAIKDAVSGKGEGEAVTQIYELLNQYLPNVEEGSSSTGDGLAGEMNKGWVN